MAGWDDEDCWSDREDLPEPLVSPNQADAFVGSVYWIADLFWGFIAPYGEAHPGLCMRCDCKHQKAVLVKGRSFHEDKAWRYDPDKTLVVQPTLGNGLRNPTVFEADLRLIDLPILASIHHQDGPLGRVSQDVFWKMEWRLAALERGLQDQEDRDESH